MELHPSLLFGYSNMRQSKTRKNKKGGGKDSYWLAGDCKAFSYNSHVLVNKGGMQTFTMRFPFTSGSEIIPGAFVQLVGQSFAISQVPNITNWTINFDKFKFVSVEIQFTPSRSTAVDGVNKIPSFYCSTDFDSDAAPTSVAEVLRKPRSLTTVFTTSFKRHFKPRVALTLYKTGLSSSYGEGMADTWVDCANADTPHFGFCWAADTQLLANQFGYKVSYVYVVTFASPIA